MPFPQITTLDLTVKSPQTKQYIREVLDYATGNFIQRHTWRERLQALYDAHNGFINEDEIASIVKFTGKNSKTKYVKYRLGHSKLKLVHGDFLKLRMASTVSTVNREAVNRKMQKYKKALGLSLAKPQIEKAREMGFDVFPGVKIPDREDPTFWKPDNFKLLNEEWMQAVINEKTVTDNLKIKFHKNFIDMTIAAELHGRVEHDRFGRISYRYIEPHNALYEENVDDMFLDRSPYRGERRLMYSHEILTNPEWKLTDEEKTIVRNWSASYNGIDRETIFTTQFPVIPVYIVEIKALEPYYIKYVYDDKIKTDRILRISQEYFRKNKRQIQSDVRTGRYRIEENEREILYELVKIGDSIYLDARKLGYLIQIEGDEGIHHIESNYCSMLFSTVNGMRVSLQELFLELERVYDDIRFQINRELKRIKGSVISYDEAFLPKNKRFIDIYHSISEDGIVRYNSAAEGNESSIDAYNGQVGIDALDLGRSQVLPTLVGQAMEVERTIDRLTGILQDRQGMGTASQTATTNMNNIEASQTMTYDHFFFMNKFVENVLIKIAEKSKLAVLTGNDTRMFVYSEDEMRFMSVTYDVALDNYGVSITDGKKETEVMQKLEAWFPQEINAGLIRSKDIARFYMESTFSKALKVLDKAFEENQAIKEREMQHEREMQDTELKNAHQMAIEDREDRQAHEKDLQVIKTEGRKEEIQLKEAIGGHRDTQKQAADLEKSRQQQSKNNLF